MSSRSPALLAHLFLGLIDRLGDPLRVFPLARTRAPDLVGMIELHQNSPRLLHLGRRRVHSDAQDLVCGTIDGNSRKKQRLFLFSGAPSLRVSGVRTYWPWKARK